MTTAVILADKPEALVKLCGVSMIERNLRVLQRLELAAATIVNAQADVRAELAKPSWARAKLQLQFAAEAPVAQRTLVVPGEVYSDPRLLKALLDSSTTTELVCDAARAPKLLVDNSMRQVLDPAQIDPYIGAIRRTLPPQCFAAPPPEAVARAEEIIFDSAQKGTLDFPAIVHAPIETWIVRRLCRTSITPNQITFVSTVLAIAVVALFARGWLWSGAIGAAIFGVLDGVDGKLARVKVETTEIGQWEHELDHALEFSWWLAFAFTFWRSGQLPHAWWFAALMIGGDLFGKLVNRPVMFHTGKPSHDFGPFERRLRLIAGRRNIYIWMLLGGLLIGRPAAAFAAACCWSAVTAGIHAVRAGYICFFTPRQKPLGA